MTVMVVYNSIHRHFLESSVTLPRTPGRPAAMLPRVRPPVGNAARPPGLPRLFANLFLLALPEDGEIVDSGETSELSTLEPDRWNIIHDVNNDALRLAETSSSWRWWRIALDGEDDADVLVIAPNDWA